MIFQFSWKLKLSYQDMIVKNELMQMTLVCKMSWRDEKIFTNSFCWLYRIYLLHWLNKTFILFPDTRYPSTCCTCSLGMTSWRKELFVMKISVWSYLPLLCKQSTEIMTQRAWARTTFCKNITFHTGSWNAWAVFTSEIMPLRNTANWQDWRTDRLR